ncbi:flagellar hook-length control protein FliK [Aestuariicoccus sp. MJ-SS9]|uniref:flagellar hook-length control protein FliK n=1 Tax=Aestuariicoccus sp. MJ-SS9 TaxID=3079855 RepID=UPI002915AA38|nr:flagellar hook-length control protein FliK [Aestuariicoccus sp. MJ-SS9]MDU8910975.1 flagellar hook-length control protein FliK [Aestuariicoccus sp. MJ-SS9]
MLNILTTLFTNGTEPQARPETANDADGSGFEEVFANLSALVEVENPADGKAVPSDVRILETGSSQTQVRVDGTESVAPAGSAPPDVATELAENNVPPRPDASWGGDEDAEPRQVLIGSTGAGADVSVQRMADLPAMERSAPPSAPHAVFNLIEGRSDASGGDNRANGSVIGKTEGSGVAVSLVVQNVPKDPTAKAPPNHKVEPAIIPPVSRRVLRPDVADAPGRMTGLPAAVSPAAQVPPAPAGTRPPGAVVPDLPVSAERPKDTDLLPHDTRQELTLRPSVSVQKRLQNTASGGVVGSAVTARNDHAPVNREGLAISPSPPPDVRVPQAGKVSTEPSGDDHLRRPRLAPSEVAGSLSNRSTLPLRAGGTTEEQVPIRADKPIVSVTAVESRMNAGIGAQPASLVAPPAVPDLPKSVPGVERSVSRSIAREVFSPRTGFDLPTGNARDVVPTDIKPLKAPPAPVEAFGRVSKSPIPMAPDWEGGSPAGGTTFQSDMKSDATWRIQSRSPLDGMPVVADKPLRTRDEPMHDRPSRGDLATPRPGAASAPRPQSPSNAVYRAPQPGIYLDFTERSVHHVVSDVVGHEGELSAGAVGPDPRFVASAGGTANIQGPTHRHDPVGVVRQIAEAVSRTRDAEVELRLNPYELGRIRMNMTPLEQGIVVSVSAERAETLDLLRRNIEQLARDLMDMGYDNPTFEFADDASGRDRPSRAPSLSEPAPIDTAAAEQKPVGSTDGGLDLRI